MNKIYRKSLLTLLALSVLAVFQISTFAQAKGMDVTEVRVAAMGTLVPETIYRQSGVKSWQVIGGGKVLQTCNETGRDEWSVYLTCAENVRTVLDLFKKEWSIIGTAGSTLKSPITSSSNSPVTAVAPPATSSVRSGEVPVNKPSPLTVNEMAHVMQWISVKTSAARLPFCWRQSYGRTAGKPMICNAGYNQDTAGLCYKPCGTDEKGIATFCYKNCPAGFRDDGLYCGKPAAYGRGAGYVIWDEAKCKRENPIGCEKWGAIWYPKCKPNFHNVGGNICSPDCPQGWEDIGVSCKKPNYAREVKPLQTCAPGLEQSGALCYPKCQNAYTGVGPVCWQNCPSQQDVDCGAGCATTKGQCAKGVFTMASAPIIAAVKIAALIVTFGGSSAATGGAAAATAGGKLALQSPKLVKLAKIAADLQRIYNANAAAIKGASVAKTVLGSIKSQSDLFATEFAKNFGDMTSPEIEKEIDRRFSPEAAFEVKRQWGIHHLGLMMEANSINTAKNVIDIAGIADPTGLVGVVSAFTNPLCKDDTPFPTVHPKY